MAKYRFPKDPFAKRESKKYDNPLPSREYILQVLEKAGKPLTVEKLVDYFKLKNQELSAIEYRLKAMERDAQVVRNRRGAYGLLDKMSLIAGRVVAHRDGYGFVIPDDNSDDFYLSPYEMRQVFHDDKVLVREINASRSGREGSIVRVLERHTEVVVGRYFEEKGIAMIAPENKYITQDILISKDSELKVKLGQMVLAQIIEQPNKKHRAIAKITEVLGDHMAPGMEIDVAIRAYQIPHEWSKGVLKEIKDVPTEVLEKETEEREDLRSLPLVTIDGATARDFDDAVFCEKISKNTYRLIVAIADVSHYVKEGTELDKEALSRGNSVYFPDKVVPMLPHALSNELCSLNPHKDRLCMACEAMIDSTGIVKKARFFQAVMQSHARLTYKKVADYLEKAEHHGIEAGLLPHIDTLYELFQLLLKQRSERGAINFETKETEIVFDKKRKIKNIIPISRNIAHQIIEECMLVANVAAAEFLTKNKLPLLYRVHDQPSLEKLTQLRAFLKQFGLSLEGGDTPSAKDYSKLLELTRSRSDSHLLQTVLLRSMAQAQYSPENIGHFGLAYEAYTHFTSPIRRYPDLLVHRAIVAALHQNKHALQLLQAQMQHCADHCSMTERRADDATRDVIAWLKCEYMLDKVGEAFPGIITSVTSFGFFVELKDVFVEGLVHVTNLTNDYYHYDDKTHSLCGERNHKRYRLGDEVNVRVARVDLDDRKMDFELVEEKSKKKVKK